MRISPARTRPFADRIDDSVWSTLPADSMVIVPPMAPSARIAPLWKTLPAAIWILPPLVVIEPACHSRSVVMSTLPPLPPSAAMLLPAPVITALVAFRTTLPFSPTSAVVALMDPSLRMVAP